MKDEATGLYQATEDFSEPGEIIPAFDRLLADQGAIPGVSQSDIDLARYTPGDDPAESSKGEPYLAMHIESRDGGDPFLRWLGTAQTLDWLRAIVGGNPLVYCTSARKAGAGRPGATTPLVGTANSANATWSVSVRLDQGSEAVLYQRFETEDAALVGEASAEFQLMAGQAIAMRHDQIRRCLEPSAETLLVEFSVCRAPDDSVPPPEQWNEKHVKARLRLQGIAESLARPEASAEIADGFSPPLRTPSEELPLIRILAAPAPATRLVVAARD